MGKLKKIDPVKNIKGKKHIGAAGNLGLGKVKFEVNKINAMLNKKENEFKAKVKGSLS